MENIIFKSNEELLDISDTLVKNHEKIKQEIMLLHELLFQVENDYLEIINELKNRTNV